MNKGGGENARGLGRARARKPGAPIGSRGSGRRGREYGASYVSASALQPWELEPERGPEFPPAVRRERQLGTRVRTGT